MFKIVCTGTMSVTVDGDCRGPFAFEATLTEDAVIIRGTGRCRWAGVVSREAAVIEYWTRVFRSAGVLRDPRPCDLN